MIQTQTKTPLLLQVAEDTTELRLWLLNPLWKHNGEPTFILAEVIEANAHLNFVEVQEVGKSHSYNAPFELCYCVHRYDTITNQVIQIYGDPIRGKQ